MQFVSDVRQVSNDTRVKKYSRVNKYYSKEIKVNIIQFSAKQKYIHI